MNPFDIEIFRIINALAGVDPGLDSAIRFFAVAFFYFLTGGICLYFAVIFFSPRFRAYLSGAKELLVVVLVSVFLSRFVITEIIRVFYDRSRPFDVAPVLMQSQVYLTQLIPHSSGGSFPSGHAAFIFALAGAIFNFYPKIGMIFFTAAFINGIARIASGIHWPSDILAGAVIGIATAWAVHRIQRKIIMTRSALS